MSWDQRFYDPIELPGRKPLVTLRDAAQYVLKLPKAERDLPQWATAIKCLMLVGEHGGDTNEVASREGDRAQMSGMQR